MAGRKKASLDMSGEPFTKKKISQKKDQQALTNDLLFEQMGRRHKRWPHILQPEQGKRCFS